MPYYKTPINYPTGRISQDTAKINENFTELAKSFVNEDPTTYKVINAHYADITYSRLTVGTSLPVSPQHNDLFYNTSDNTLRKYDARTNTWTTIDWQTIVRASPEWRAGRLRINSSTGRLEISPDGTNWYECIPAVGSQAIELASIDNNNYSLLYWIAPGQTVIIRNANHIPIVYAKDVVPFFSGSVLSFNNFDSVLGLRPSNVAIFDGLVQYVFSYSTTTLSGLLQNLNFVPVVDGSDFSPNWGNFEMRVSPTNFFAVNSLAQASQGFSLVIYNSSGTASATSYWLGTWFTLDGQQFIMNNLTLTRRA